MSELAQQFFDILLKAEHPKAGAVKIADIVEKAAHAIAVHRQAEAKAFADLRQILDRFYAYEGRAASLIQAIQLIDQGGSMEAVRDALMEMAHKYRDEMSHYQVLLKAMQ